jgi:hypothetical protein
MAEKVSLSSSGLKEHNSLDNRSGSIGTTRSTKYTEVALSSASLSSNEPSGT